MGRSKSIVKKQPYIMSNQFIPLLHVAFSAHCLVIFKRILATFGNGDDMIFCHHHFFSVLIYCIQIQMISSCIRIFLFCKIFTFDSTPATLNSFREKRLISLTICFYHISIHINECLFLFKESVFYDIIHFINGIYFFPLIEKICDG